MKRPYSEKEVSNVLDMRKRGMIWKEIAKSVGRNEKALYSKFAKMRRGEQKNPIVEKRKYTKSNIAKISPTGVTQYRPMIALVGSPSEVTTTIRELFS